MTLILVSFFFSLVYFSLGSEIKYFAPNLVAYALGLAPQERTLGRLFRPEYRWVDWIAADARIGVNPDYFNLIYPLFGPYFQREVVRIQPYSATDFLSRLRQEKIDYIFALEGTQDDTWAQYDPVHFHQIDTIGDYHVYQIQGSLLKGR